MLIADTCITIFEGLAIDFLLGYSLFVFVYITVYLMRQLIDTMCIKWKPLEMLTWLYQVGIEFIQRKFCLCKLASFPCYFTNQIQVLTILSNIYPTIVCTAYMLDDIKYHCLPPSIGMYFSSSLLSNTSSPLPFTLSA